GDGGRGGEGRPVGGPVGERVGPVVVRGRGVREAAVGVERERPVLRLGQDRGRQRRPVHVRVVQQDARGVDRKWAVLVQGERVVRGDRRVVDRVDRQADCRRTAVQGPV